VRLRASGAWAEYTCVDQPAYVARERAPIVGQSW
jgi:hypothetical protein